MSSLPPGFDLMGSHSGAVAVEMFDSLRDLRIELPVVASVDAPLRQPVDKRSLHQLGLFYSRILARPAVGQPPVTAVIRIDDPERRYVPRRVRVRVIDPATPALRLRRVDLFPGAAWPGLSGATGLRGRVQTAAGATVRWARVEARLDGAVVGRAHGDDRGEFLLLLWPAVAAGGDPGPTVSVRVRVFTPSPLPEPASFASDALGDLVIESVDLADGQSAPLARGVGIPPGYGAAPLQRQVLFTVGRIRTDEAAFIV